MSSIVSFRPPRHLFLHFFFWHLFVIIVIVWQINKIPKCYSPLAAKSAGFLAAKKD